MAKMVLHLMLLLLPLLATVRSQTDQTLVPETYGQEVVFAVNSKLRSSNIFGDDNRFLVRMAYVETTYGYDSKTYRTPTSGGIWQVPQNVFEATKEVAPNPSYIRDRVRGHFNIDWWTVNLMDCLKPMYSGLAIRIFLSTLPVRIPDTIAGQAAFWKQYINVNGSVQHFIDTVKRLESDNICEGKMDFVIALDGSGSIQQQNFDIAKTFVQNLTSRFDLETVNIGFIVYSDTPRAIFQLNNNLTQTTMSQAIQNVLWPRGSTATHLAIRLANSWLPANQSSSIPRVLIVFTDGQSDIPPQTAIAANETQMAGIISFSVGIGPAVNNTELLIIAGGDPTRVISSSSFDALAELPYRLNEETCSVPQTPPMNTSISDTLKANETRYFSYEFPAAGITLQINVATGSTTMYFSFTFSTPSSAIHDGLVTDKGEIFLQPPGTLSASSRQNDKIKQLFVAVKGLSPTNTFTVHASTGDNRNAGITFSSNVIFIIFTIISAKIFF